MVCIQDFSRTQKWSKWLSEQLEFMVENKVPCMWFLFYWTMDRSAFTIYVGILKNDYPASYVSIETETKRRLLS